MLIVYILCLIIISSKQANIESILNNKVNFIFEKFRNTAFYSYNLQYKNKVYLNRFRIFNLIELNKDRTMINNNTIEVHDCLILIQCNIHLELSKNSRLIKTGIIFEYNISNLDLSYNSINNSFYISNLKISNIKYPLIDESVFKLNQELMEDINITNGLFYNFTYNLTYNHIIPLCEDINLLINDFFNVLNITQKYLKEELKQNKINFYSFNTNYSEYFFTPMEEGILINNVSFILKIKYLNTKINCYYLNFYFGKKMYMHTLIHNNISNSYTNIQEFIYQNLTRLFDIVFKKSKKEYYEN